MFYDILERKNVFVGYKNKKFNKSKNRHFSKGVSPLVWSKIVQFLTFFYREYLGRKMCFMIF